MSDKEIAGVFVGSLFLIVIIVQIIDFIVNRRR